MAVVVGCRRALQSTGSWSPLRRRAIPSMNKFVRHALALAILADGTTAIAQVNNGSFETGDFSWWTVSGDTGFVGVCDVTNCPGGFAPQDGNFAGYFGPVGDTATISQTIA